MRHSITRIIFASLMVFLFAGFAAYPQAQNQAAQAQQQTYRAAVDRAKHDPFRVEVQPTQQGVHPGATTDIKVELRNADNQVVNATQTVALEFRATSPAQKQQTQKVEIPAHSSSAMVKLAPDQAGLWKLEIREVGDSLKSGSSYLAVSAAPPPAKAKPAQKKIQKKISMERSLPRPRLVAAAYSFQPQPAPESPIVLRVAGENDGRVRADGSSAAVVSVFLIEPKTVPVRVWLNVDHGQLAQPVVTIPAGEVFGTDNWTSTTPVQGAKVTISQTSPAIAGISGAGATVDFVDPIVAIAFANPPSSMNIVEIGTLAVRFLDGKATPIPAHFPLSYRFSANHTYVQLTPQADQTRPDAVDFTTSITPSGFGEFTVEAAVPGLKPISQPIKITGLMLLALCALAGAAGGFVNHLDRQTKGLAASLATGAIVALPVIWLYVWIGLPNISASFMHNQFSALMIAVIAGLGGASGLKLAAKAFGIGLFDTKADGGSGDGGAKAATVKP